MSPADLQGLFSKLSLRRDADLLVGIETGDDAAIYRLSDETALVVTADFITPPTEDPYLYGQIAAANSISDVYAMGGRPLTALNLCMFPVKVGAEVLAQILQGGLDKIHESGAFLVGGHTVKDDELKYGLSVNGLVHPKRYTPNSGARAEDAFILTKPLGTGVYIAGNKKGAVSAEEFAPVAARMAELNRVAAETMMEFGARGATDITGFGFGGHVFGMAKASRIAMRFYYDELPKHPRAVELVEKGFTTALTPSNQKLLDGVLQFQGAFTPAEQGLFYDPQTSGGLFFGVLKKDADACLRKLHERGVKDARIVGEGVVSDRPRLDVVRNR